MKALEEISQIDKYQEFCKEFIEEYKLELRRQYTAAGIEYLQSWEDYLETEYERYVAQKDGWRNGSNFLELY